MIGCMVTHVSEELSMEQEKRDLRAKATKRDVIAALFVLGFIIITAILSYFYGNYGILRFIAGGEKLFRFWILVGVVIFGVYGVSRIRRRNKHR